MKYVPIGIALVALLLYDSKTKTSEILLTQCTKK